MVRFLERQSPDVGEWKKATSENASFRSWTAVAAAGAKRRRGSERVFGVQEKLEEVVPDVLNALDILVLPVLSETRRNSRLRRASEPALDQPIRFVLSHHHVSPKQCHTNTTTKRHLCSLIPLSTRPPPHELSLSWRPASCPPCSNLP